MCKECKYKYFFFNKLKSNYDINAYDYFTIK